MLKAEQYGAEALTLVQRVISQVIHDLHEAPNSPNSANSANSASTTRKLRILNSFQWHLSSVERTQWSSSIAETPPNYSMTTVQCTKSKNLHTVS